MLETYKKCIYISIRVTSMETHIQKWGNSIGLRIPAKLARKLNLHVGNVVNLQLQNNHLEITPKKQDLAEMVAQINRSNLHN